MERAATRYATHWQLALAALRFSCTVSRSQTYPLTCGNAEVEVPVVKGALRVGAENAMKYGAF